MTTYDQWKQTDQLSEQMADYETKHAAIAAGIRAELSQSDYQVEIEVDASLNAECNAAIARAFYGEAGCEDVLFAFAQKWLDDQSERMATERMQGGSNE
jgi:hypothetical protein